MAQDTYTVMIHKSKTDAVGLITTDEKEARAFAASYAHDAKWTAEALADITSYRFDAGPVEV
jgi:hypothetical protein